MDIACSPGQLTIAFPDLFSLTALAPLRRFVERIVRVDELISVTVQFSRGTAVLRFEAGCINVSDLLTKMARALDEPSPANSTARYVSVDLDHSRRKSTRFRPIREDWIVIGDETRQLCVQSPLLELEPSFAESLAARLSTARGVLSAQVRGPCLWIDYDSRQSAASETRELWEQAVRESNEQYWAALREAAEVRVVVKGARRMIYIGLTLASFGMMIVAFILPGIPTPPFLVATTYFGVQSSPRFYRRLCRTWLFGRMVRDWRDHRAFRWEDKVKSVLLTLALILVGIVWLGVAGPLLIVVLCIALAEIIWLAVMPEVVVAGRTNRGPTPRLVASTAG